MIKTFVESESMTITDFRLRRWFKKIADAETDGWRLLSVKVVPGWFIDYYTAHLIKNSSLQLEFVFGPIKDRT